MDGKPKTKVAQVGTTSGKSAAAAAQAEEESLDDLIPRMNFAGMSSHLISSTSFAYFSAARITPELVASLGDKNWKIRGEGLEQVGGPSTDVFKITNFTVADHSVTQRV